MIQDYITNFKNGHIAVVQVYFQKSNSKKSQVRPKWLMRVEVFILKIMQEPWKLLLLLLLLLLKIAGALKNYFIFDLHNPSFYIKEHLPKQQSKIRIF